MRFLHILRHYPFVRLIIPFIAGIIAGMRVNLSLFLPLSALTMLLFAMLVVQRFYARYGIRWLFGIFTYLAFFCLGIFILNMQKSKIRDDMHYHNQHAVFQAIVLKNPTEKEKSVGAILRIQHLFGDTQNNNQIRVIAYFQKENRSINLKAGDVLIVRSLLKRIEGPTNPYEFNYRYRMSLKNICHTTFISSESWYKKGFEKSLFSIAAAIRCRIFTVYDKCGIKGDELAVLSALTLGYKDQLSDEITQYYAASGAMHILAVSGLHVGIIFLLLNHILFFLKKFRFGKIIRLVVILVSLWSFAAIAGFSPSVSRAAFMFSVIQFGITLRKPPEIYNTIAFSAFFLLLINPFNIADVGFQLSYLAVTGIVFFQPRLYNLLYVKNKMLDYIWQLIAVSAAAQLATAPLSVFYFHYFPTLFWITNIFVIPLAALIIYSAVLLVVFFYLQLPYLFIGKILYFILKIQNYLIFRIQSVPCAMIENIDISSLQVIIYFTIIICMSVFFMLKKRLFFMITMALAACYLLLHTLNVIKIEQQNKLVVFNIRSKTVISMVQGRNAFFISDIDEPASVSELFQIKNFIIKSGIRKIEGIRIPGGDEPLQNNPFTVKSIENNIFFINGKFKGVVLNNPDFCNRTFLKPLDVNCVILARNINVNMDQLSRCFNTAWIVLDSSNGRGYRSKWHSQKKGSHPKLFSVADAGAFQIQIN